MIGHNSDWPYYRVVSDSADYLVIISYLLHDELTFSQFETYM